MKSGKKYFKNGNPNVWGHINAVTWKRMTEKERAMWTPYDEAHEAPIPDDVLEFTKKNPPPSTCEENRCKKLEDEVAKLKDALEATKGKVEFEISADPVEIEVEVKPKQKVVVGDGDERTTLAYPDEDAQRKQLLEECRKRGIKTTHNMKLETLQKKLKDADNSE